ncbi:DUF3500 domain-containing protein [uncultured Kriegella sp.]|uniref:DUF3500 domain-containing protein n=1 Tax=uncultured Kriegella sp. TaxID=1798910 RepID=UPI0030D92B63|tara:strand:- start:20472 stop:21503 length:1032 start_codon:yes stop_codon:yes gene_type:complete
MRTFKKAVLLIIFSFFLNTATAQDLSEKANNFLSTLTQELKAKAFFPLDDAERTNFNFVPMDRKGPTFHDFNETQKQAALDLLRASLSEDGYRKTTDIMSLEKVLHELLNDPSKTMSDGRPYRDPLNYHFCIFGTPSPTDFWGWRFEGHHVSVNFTSTQGKIISSTPSFFGSNPGIVQSTAAKGKEVLKKETDLGFKLVNSLEPNQLKTAKFSDEAPYEIITTNKVEVGVIETKGITYSALTKNQKEIFMELLNVYLGTYEADFAAHFKKRIKKAGMENLRFAWAGSLKAGIPNYYRIHGPILLIEYANTQNNANHVHTAIRDLENDFAKSALKEHYEEHHHN